MDKAIIENHALLSDTAVSFLDYAVEQGKCLKSLESLNSTLPEMVREFGGHHINSWPNFISEETRQMFQDCACQVAKIMCKTIRLEFDNDSAKLAEFYRIPEIFASIFVDDEVDMEQITLRVDAIWAEHGLKILELNVGSSLGGWEGKWWDAQYLKEPSLKPFFDSTNCQSSDTLLLYFEFLIKMVQRSHFDDKGVINIFIMVSKEFLRLKADQSFKKLFRKSLEKYRVKGNLYMALNYDGIDFRVNGAFIDGARLGACISILSLHRAKNNQLKLFRNYLARQIYWPDNPLFSLLGDKRSLGIMSKNKDHPSITPDEHAFIEKFVPWSAPFQSQQITFREHSHDLELLVRQQKDDFVLKIGKGLQGKDVFIGKATSPIEWETVIQRALEDGTWLVQEYCQSRSYYAQWGDEGYNPSIFIWGIFGFGDMYGGCCLRMMNEAAGDGIVNAARGAEVSVVYEVKE